MLVLAEHLYSECSLFTLCCGLHGQEKKAIASVARHAAARHGRSGLKLLEWLLMQVPNPMFDLAGILCGQFLVPFWKFFAATLIGKAVIKTHIQVSEEHR